MADHARRQRDAMRGPRIWANSTCNAPYPDCSLLTSDRSSAIWPFMSDRALAAVIETNMARWPGEAFSHCPTATLSPSRCAVSRAATSV